MKCHKIQLAGVPVLLLLPALTYAQAPGSSVTYKGLGLSGIQSDAAETLYIGPGNYIIDGTWNIYSKNVVVDPGASISGLGSIIFYNPAAAGAAAALTSIDGNASGNAIEVNVIHQNEQGMQLSNINVPADLTGNGYINNTGASSVYLGKDMSLATDGADILLGTGVTGDLRFDTDATISNYNSQRMVITNNSTFSHIVKEGNGGTFYFPVGIADGNYTPVSITGSNTYHVSVIDYSSANPLILQESEGMGRVWQVYGGPASSISLYHNPATNGLDFIDNQAFLTRYLGGGNWSVSATPDYAGTAGVHTNSGTLAATIPSTADTTYSFLSKASDMSSPLPLMLTAFNAVKKNREAYLTWTIEQEAALKGFEVERSTDGHNWKPVGCIVAHFSGNNDTEAGTYSFTDQHPESGANFYRIRIEETDGGDAYSQVKVLVFDVPQIEVYPNPFRDHIIIEGLSEKAHILVSDMSGRQLLKTTKEPGAGYIALPELSKGIYMLHILDEQGTIMQTLKLIKE